MKSSLAFVAVCVLACTTTLAWAQDSDAVSLTADGFDGDTQTGAWFVMFKAFWCGHCKALTPKWDVLATKTKGHVNIGVVECTEQRSLCQDMGIRGFPTLRLFKDGELAGEYRGPRTVEALEEFIRDNGAYDYHLPDNEVETEAANAAPAPTPEPEVHADQPPAPPKQDSPASPPADHKNSDVVLRYFGAQGRAEAVRLALEERGIEYQDIRFNRDTWPDEKQKGTEAGIYTFGQLPELSIDGKHIVQSGAILRHLARREGLYGSAGEETMVDVVFDGAEDMRKAYGKLVYSSGFDADRPAYVNEYLPLWLGHMERLKAKSPHAEFFVGEQLTIADISMFNILDVNTRLEPSCLDAYPNLKVFKERFAARPRIASYLSSQRRPVHANGPTSFYDNENRPAKGNLRK